MEKLVYTVWRDDWNDHLRQHLSAAVRGLPGAQNLQLNLPDGQFEGGQDPIRNLLPRFDGIVSVWMQSRCDRDPLEDLLRELQVGFHGYAVCESQPLRAQLPAPAPGGRIHALSQVCLLQRPDDLGAADWLSYWLDEHTRVAIECQGTIAYVQNIVQAAVTADAPEIHGVVEECYPVEAYADLGVFFGAPNNPEMMTANIQRLLDSSARFAPVDHLDRIFTARYCLANDRETLAAAAGDEDR